MRRFSRRRVAPAATIAGKTGVLIAVRAAMRRHCCLRVPTADANVGLSGIGIEAAPRRGRFDPPTARMYILALRTSRSVFCCLPRGSDDVQVASSDHQGGGRPPVGQQRDPSSWRLREEHGPMQRPSECATTTGQRSQPPRSSMSPANDLALSGRRRSLRDRDGRSYRPAPAAS